MVDLASNGQRPQCDLALSDRPRICSSAYLSPMAAPALPIAPDVFMRIVGLVEIAVGISILFAAPIFSHLTS
jgi:hypothetical protein